VRFALKRTNDRVATPRRTSMPTAPKSVAIHDGDTLTGGCCFVRRDSNDGTERHYVTTVT
jgi:hypothetical protein